MTRLWPILIFAVFDLVLAVGLTYWSPRSDESFMFFAALTILWVLPFLIGIWNMAKFWIAYTLFLRRRLVRVFKAQFHQSKLPSAQGHFDHMNYLSSVIDDEELSQIARAKAAYYVGELAAYKADRPFTMGLAAQHAFEQAMEEYRP